MEVHHHAGHDHGTKGFKEYFLEFLMIFLAVVLGFIAENARETISDNRKEKEYIESLVQNLCDDTTSLRINIFQNQLKAEKLRKLMSLSMKDLSGADSRVMFYKACSGSIGFYSIFKTNDATMLQLKSGALRLIRKHHVADSITRYDNEMKIIYAAEAVYNNATELGILATHDVLDYRIYYDTSFYKNGSLTGKFIPFASDDPQKMKSLFNKVDFEIGATNNYINNLQLRVPIANRLIAYLKKEYSVK